MGNAASGLRHTPSSFDTNGKCRLRFAPYAVLIRHHRTERVLARRQIRVERHVAVACVPPPRVESLQYVVKAKPARCTIRWGCEAYFDISACAVDAQTLHAAELD